MRRWSATLLAFVAILCLAFVVKNYSNSADDGAATRARPVSPSVPPGPLAPASGAGCILGELPGDGDTPFVITVTGACEGTLSGDLACGDNEEVFNGSVQQVVETGDVFVLTVLIPEFTGSGDYDNAELFAQLSGNSSARWTSRDVRVLVDGEDVHFTAADLAAEPGTATTGSLLLTGDVSCGGAVGEGEGG